MLQSSQCTHPPTIKLANNNTDEVKTKREREGRTINKLCDTIINLKTKRNKMEELTAYRYGNNTFFSYFLHSLGYELSNFAVSIC